VTIPLLDTPQIPEYGDVQKTTDAKVIETDYGDGYTQRTEDGINSIKRSYSVRWQQIPIIDAQAIDDFLRARKGVEPFYYQLPSELTTILFTCKNWQRQPAGPNLDTISASFVECFDPDAQATPGGADPQPGTVVVPPPDGPNKFLKSGTGPGYLPLVWVDITDAGER
jgi:phage-related protein